MLVYHHKAIERREANKSEQDELDEKVASYEYNEKYIKYIGHIRMQTALRLVIKKRWENALGCTKRENSDNMLSI